MSEMKDVVPSEFYRGDEEKPYCETVGELIEQLQRLPCDLPIKQGYEDGCTLTVYNIKTDAHLEITEADEG